MYMFTSASSRRIKATLAVKETKSVRLHKYSIHVHVCLESPKVFIFQSNFHILLCSLFGLVSYNLV